MPDREKVIKAIETHLSTDISVGCDDCTYENDGWCTTRVLADVLTLLKEQEADDPVKLPPHRGFPDGAWDWGCPKCNYQIGHMWNFCPRCGQAVKWDA